MLSAINSVNVVIHKSIIDAARSVPPVPQVATVASAAERPLQPRVMVRGARPSMYSSDGQVIEYIRDGAVLAVA